MEVAQIDERQGHSGGNMFTDGGFAMNTYQHGGKKVNMRRLSKRASAVQIAATAAAIMFFVTTAFAGQDEGRSGLLRAGNGPGPAANGPGPGCNVIPPLASIGTIVDI